MGIELAVLDFDGTLTDVDREAVPAVEGWRNDVGRDLSFTPEQIQQRWLAVESKIRADPVNYGWLRGDKIIAPACADPFVLATVVTQVLFDEEGKYLNKSERDDIIRDKFFKKNYEKAITIFKDNTDQFLSKLREMFDVCIATNSYTLKVSEKIKQLPTNHSVIPIYGDARKYNLQPDWTEVPESVERDGFGRPLFLRRKQYWDILQQIMDERKLNPEQIAVVGDIYELDLLLPEYKGMKVVLTPRESTLCSELAAVKKSPFGYVARDLEKVVKHLEAQK